MRRICLKMGTHWLRFYWHEIGSSSCTVVSASFMDYLNKQSVEDAALIDANLNDSSDEEHDRCDTDVEAMSS